MFDLDRDKLHEECGVFGIAPVGQDAPDPVWEVRSALYALQHRGQQSCGVAVSDHGALRVKKGDGLVSEVLTDKALSVLKGQMAIGHVRYTAFEGTGGVSAQPIVTHHCSGDLALCNNGNLVNAAQLRREIELRGGIFQSWGHGEIIACLIVRERLNAPTLEDALINAMRQMTGAYSLVLMSGQSLYGVRDPNGFRPLCIGKVGDSYLLASESCAIDALGGSFIRDVEPGEIVVIENGALRSVSSGIAAREALCVFEYIYFARPDSVISGISVEKARQDAGIRLAMAERTDADVVIGVPDSGLSAALGYSYASGIPYAVGLVKNRYIGRTFIEPTQGQRAQAVKIKLNALGAVVSGRRVIMVDDSIVRGTTLHHTISILREAGAAEVHLKIASPPFLHPCYFGTDIPRRENLIAHNQTVEDLRAKIGVDSLQYLTTQDLKATMGGRGYCDACFTGGYAVNVSEGGSVV